MNQRVRLSFGDAELLFSPYDAEQLGEIMRAREDAFYDGALESAVIRGRQHLQFVNMAMHARRFGFSKTPASSPRKNRTRKS
jgi:hypothetical protein